MRSPGSATPDDIELPLPREAIKRALPLLLTLATAAGIVMFGVLSTTALSKRLLLAMLAMTAPMLLGLASIMICELLVRRRANATPMLDRPVPGADPRRVQDCDSSIDAIAGRLSARSATQGGFRTMIAPDNGALDCSAEAIALTKALSLAGRQVLLVNWSLSETGLAHVTGAPAAAGINDLLTGAASFEELIRPLAGSSAHYMACSAVDADPRGLDADRLNMVLDALDEAYDHIIVSGDHDGARQLFKTIEGRFDHGITVAGPANGEVGLRNSPDHFLGFEVMDLEVIRFERPITFERLGPASNITRMPRRAAAEMRL